MSFAHIPKDKKRMVRKLKQSFEDCSSPTETMIQAENKIPTLKTGTEFLAASHFTISNDSRWGPRHDPEAHKSIFKIDYPPLPLTKRGRIPSPPPAGIMHKDDRYADTTSMTKSHFVKKPLSKRKQEYSSYALRKTNFKGDSDSKLKSFQTTHKEYFPVRPLQEAKAHPSTTKAEWMRSCIPQGDKEKEVWPESDYRSRYLGEQTQGPVLAKGDLSGRLTITGDPRTQNGQYITTAKTEFVSRYLPKQSIDPSFLAGGSNIPLGDQEKCNDKISTQQYSYRPVKTTSSFAPFDKEEAVKRLRQTTFKLGDQRSPGNLHTTAADSYPYPIMESRSTAANVNMGQSSFPEGDLHPERSHERITKTTNDIFFGNPAIGYKNTLIKGSHLRTKSNVHLGHSASSKYYDTSMKTDYTALPNIHKNQQIGNSNNSSLPLDYYRGFVGVPTTWNDFQSHAGIPKLLPNPLSLQNLKMSHIHPQIPGEREFSTTHQRCYTPKKSSRIDVKLGSLQRSSVPLGNLNMYQ